MFLPNDPLEQVAPTFEVKFDAPGLRPETVPLRAVSDALSALQDLASGRDPYVTAKVPLEKGIGLVDVRTGSAIYQCVARAPDEAVENLGRIGAILSPGYEHDEDDDLVAALPPIRSLSEIAKVVRCSLVVRLTSNGQAPLFVIRPDDYERLSKRLFLTGETTVIGKVMRAGGATGMRCLMRVPGRRKILYCDVKDKRLVRRLGQHLYETIAATGTATWIHRSWRIQRFKINDFTQPTLGNPDEAMEELTRVGLKAWDCVDDPEAYLGESST